MLDSTQSSDGVITKPSSKSVPQTIDGLKRFWRGIVRRGRTDLHCTELRPLAA
jgi:hypothetical protein